MDTTRPSHDTTATRPRAFLVAACVSALALTACGTNATEGGVAQSQTETASEQTTEQDTTSEGTVAQTSATDRQEIHYSEGDEAWDAASASQVTLSGSSATTDDESVLVAGSTVTITAAGTYVVRGTMDDGSLVVETSSEDLVRIVLDGADVTNSSGPAIDVVSADEVVVVLADGTTNSLSGGADSGAALDSAADLTIAGTGSLTVEGTVNDAIASADGLVVVDATIEATAVDDGIRGKDYLVVSGATVTVDAGGDGLVSDNTEDAARGYVTLAGSVVSITAGGDGVAAATDLDVSSGEVDVTAGGGSSQPVADDASAKGLKAGVALSVLNGTIVVDAADDAIHSNDSIAISGGQISLASGDDGVHADATLTITGGTIDVSESYEGIESAVIVIEGGDLTIRSSDDGINVSGGNDASGFGPGGGAQGGPGGDPRGGGGTGGDQFADTGNQSLTITGGTIVVDADGDGADVNGSMTMTGGVLTIHGPTEQMNGALDATSIDVSGGVLTAAGSAGMAQAPTSGSQAVLGVRLGSGLPAGSVVTITGDDGTVVTTFTTTKVTETLVLSSPDLAAGSTYTVAVDGSELGSLTAS